MNNDVCRLVDNYVAANKSSLTTPGVFLPALALQLKSAGELCLFHSLQHLLGP